MREMDVAQILQYFYLLFILLFRHFFIVRCKLLTTYESKSKLPVIFSISTLKE